MPTVIFLNLADWTQPCFPLSKIILNRRRPLGEFKAFRAGSSCQLLYTLMLMRIYWRGGSLYLEQHVISEICHDLRFQVVVGKIIYISINGWSQKQFTLWIIWHGAGTWYKTGGLRALPPLFISWQGRASIQTQDWLSITAVGTHSLNYLFQLIIRHLFINLLAPLRLTLEWWLGLEDLLQFVADQGFFVIFERLAVL